MSGDLAKQAAVAEGSPLPSPEPMVAAATAAAAASTLSFCLLFAKEARRMKKIVPTIAKAIQKYPQKSEGMPVISPKAPASE